MHLLISPSSDPFQNLAIEEYLLKSSSEDFVFLYVNRPCVVVGKHQIAVKEIDSQYTFRNNILIARRLSGGGTVFHDEGNLNFSFISNVPPGSCAFYRTLTEPIIRFLQDEGAPVYLSERNDIMLSDSKVSGSAMHVYKNRVLAHCTLLIDCNLTNLSSSLQTKPERFLDKSIASVRSKVANLSDNYPYFSVSNAIDKFTEFIKHENRGSSFLSISEEDQYHINLLASEKYSSHEWIYGYSPKYTYKNSLEYNGNILKYRLEVEKGVIKNVQIESLHQLTSTIELEFNTLIGRPHHIFAFPLHDVNLLLTDFSRLLINSLF
jgi:lipoate-protein ligase A